MPAFSLSHWFSVPSFLPCWAISVLSLYPSDDLGSYKSWEHIVLIFSILVILLNNYSSNFLKQALVQLFDNVAYFSLQNICMEG